MTEVSEFVFQVRSRGDAYVPMFLVVLPGMGVSRDRVLTLYREDATDAPLAMLFGNNTFAVQTACHAIATAAGVLVNADRVRAELLVVLQAGLIDKEDRQVCSYAATGSLLAAQERKLLTVEDMDKDGFVRGHVTVTLPEIYECGDVNAFEDLLSKKLIGKTGLQELECNLTGIVGDSLVLYVESYAKDTFSHA